MVELGCGGAQAVLEHEHGLEGGKTYMYLASKKNSLERDAAGLLTKQNFSLCSSSLC